MAPFLSRIAGALDALGGQMVRDAALMTVQAGLLLGILGVLDLLLLRQIRASVRYAAWSLMLVKLLLPVTLATPVSIGEWLPNLEIPATAASHPATPAHARQRPPEIGSAPSLDGRIASGSEGRMAPGDAMEAGVGSSVSSISLEQARTEGGKALPQVSPVDVAPSMASYPSPFLLRWPGGLFLCWLLGVVAFSVAALHHMGRVRRIVGRSTEPPAECVQALGDCAAKMGVGLSRVRLRVTNDLASPAICGFWTGCILLPRPLVGTLTRDQIRLVLGHELAHWRRGDLQVNLLQTLLQIAHFYNPVVWIANAILRRLREHAVDEAVLVAFQAQPRDYARTLIEIAAGAQPSVELSIPMLGIAETGRSLAARITRMLARPAPRAARLGCPRLMLVFVAGVIFVPMARSTSVKELAAKRMVPMDRRIELLAVDESDGAPRAAPAPSVHISGSIEVDRIAALQGFWIDARSSDGLNGTATYYREGADKSFQLGPIPPGTYRLSIMGWGVILDSARLSTSEDEVDLVVKGIGWSRLSRYPRRIESGRLKATDLFSRFKIPKVPETEGAVDPNWLNSGDSVAGRIDVMVLPTVCGVYELELAPDGRIMSLTAIERDPTLSAATFQLLPYGTSNF